MSDIVDNLSDYIRAGFDPHNQLKEARSEIERLRAEIARLREAMEEYVNTVVKMEGVTFVDQMENSELRAVVESILAKQKEKP